MDYSSPQTPAKDSGDFPLAPDPDASMKEQPEWRMGNYSRLLELVVSADHSDSRRRFLDVCAEVDDMYDRKPPDDDQALLMDGLGWTNNVDWGGMEFGIDSAIAPEFNLLHMPETYVKLETVYQGLAASDQKRTVEIEDKRMLDEWDDWIPELGKMLFHRKKYGLGLFYFREPRSWQFQALHPGNLLTSSPHINPSKWSWCAIHTEFDIPDLMGKLYNEGKNTDEDGFSDDGWNRESIKRALKAHKKQGRGFDIVQQFFNDAERWRHEYLADDLYWSHVNDMTIPGYIVYVREFDGTVTEYLMTRKERVGFLYRSSKKKRLKQMSDAFSMWPQHPWQNQFREVRGYGIKNLAFFDAENNLNNRLLDSSYLSSSLFVEGGTPDDLYNQQEMLVGPITMMPSNLTIAASQMPNPAQALVPVTEHLTRLRMNAGQATGGGGYGSAPDRETAKAATLRFQQGQRMQNFDVRFLYKLAEKFHRIRFGRYMAPGNMISRDSGYKEAQLAKERMALKGVTEEFMKSIDLKGTSVGTIFGDGDPAKQFADLTELMPVMGRMTENGITEFMRDMAHAKVGHDRAVAYFGDTITDPNLIANRHQAQLENGHFESADAAVEPKGDDNHLVHVGEHIQFLEAKVNAMQQGGASPEEIFKTISRAMGHLGFDEEGQVTGGHVAALLQDPVGAEPAKDFIRRMSDLVNLRRQLGQQMQAQQESAQQEQLQNLKQPMEEQAKAAKVQAEIQVNQQKAEIEIARLREEAAFQERKQDLEIELLEAKLMAAQTPKPPSNDTRGN